VIAIGTPASIPAISVATCIPDAILFPCISILTRYVPISHCPVTVTLESLLESERNFVGSERSKNSTRSTFLAFAQNVNTSFSHSRFIIKSASSLGASVTLATLAISPRVSIHPFMDETKTKAKNTAILVEKKYFRI